MPAVARRRNAARLLWIAALGLSALGVAIAGRRIALLLRPTGSPEPTPGSALPFETMDAMFVEHRVVTLVHVVSGLRFVVLGPLQFHRGLRSRPPR